MSSESTVHDLLLDEFRSLCNRAHSLGATVVVGFATYDPIKQVDSFDYATAGSYYAALGVAHELGRRIADPDLVEID